VCAGARSVICKLHLNRYRSEALGRESHRKKFYIVHFPLLQISCLFFFSPFYRCGEKRARARLISVRQQCVDMAFAWRTYRSTVRTSQLHNVMEFSCSVSALLSSNRFFVSGVTLLLLARTMPPASFSLARSLFFYESWLRCDNT